MDFVCTPDLSDSPRAKLLEITHAHYIGKLVTVVTQCSRFEELSHRFGFTALLSAWDSTEMSCKKESGNPALSFTFPRTRCKSKNVH